LTQIEVRYEGGLRCSATHGPSGATLSTDAPVDNQGQGRCFAPTDLLATSLGACSLTVMAIVAERHGWPLTGANASVEKEMVADPNRRVGRLTVEIRVPGEWDERQRTTLERAAHTCPVSSSLGDGIDVTLRFVWGS
jgi:putative redox protein